MVYEVGREAINEHQLIRRTNAKISEIDLKTVKNLMMGAKGKFKSVSTKVVSLPVSLRSNLKSHRSIALYPSLAKTEKFNNSAVLKTIRHLNKTRYAKRVQAPSKDTTTIIHNGSRRIDESGKPLIQYPTCPNRYKQLSKHKCKGLPI